MAFHKCLNLENIKDLKNKLHPLKPQIVIT